MKKKKVPKIPRVNSLVKFDFETQAPIIAGFEKYFSKFKKMTLIYLGEIPNMPGHGIYINADGKHEFHIGYHTDSFVELTEDET